MPVKKQSKKSSTSGKAYIVTVDMGYGHQRAVHPLGHLAAINPHIAIDEHDPIISANVYPGIPAADKRRWEGGRGLYETISRMKKLPIIGEAIFGMMDRFQQIEPYYPRRDQSAPTLQVKQIFSMIQKGWGKDLIDKLNTNPLPYITSFFTTAFFAQVHGYSGPIYCLCTDTDVSRAWVALEPKKSNIIYLAPTKRVKERLIQYGVPKERVLFVGFPLPTSCIGTRTKQHLLRQSLGCRIGHLDPQGVYQKKYQATLDMYLGKQYCSSKSSHPLTIMFAVGGAGAQREIGTKILTSLRAHIAKGNVKLYLVAGSRNDVYRYYQEKISELRLNKKVGDTVELIYAAKKTDYFAAFNKALTQTDILWTKPSELSFFAGLGLPIIMSPTIGSQETYNQAWLRDIGAGIDQLDPAYTHEWLFDLLQTGWLAQAAMEGFMDAPNSGTFIIEDLIRKGTCKELPVSQPV